MIVADTSALVSLAIAASLDLVLDEFDVHTTETVIQELEETGAYDDVHGNAASAVLDNLEGMTVHRMEADGFESSRVDPGEGSCVRLTGDLEARFLITDDLRALPELQTLADARVALSPIVLDALVKRGVLGRGVAADRLEELTETRDWLGAPIYRRAMSLFDDESGRSG